jgi:DNA-binding winged helix-turn-helix (wHTH) protein/Tol biopolymer transport system component
VFELDLRSGELRKSGVRLNVQDQPPQVLTLLLERPGELVTRDEIRQELWPSDTFVGFEHGLNAAVARLRETLGDSADTPRFIETLPRRGYRFVGTLIGDDEVSPFARRSENKESHPPPQPLTKPAPVRLMGASSALALGVVLLLAWGAFELGRRAAAHPQPVFHQLTFRRGGVVSARFAPDGKTVVYGAAWDGNPVRIFSTRIEGPESSALSLPDADVADISSWAEMLVILKRPYAPLLQPGTLARVPLGGGSPRAIAEGVTAATWSADRQQFAITREVGGHSRVEYPPGRIIHECYEARAPRLSPDGNRLAFYARETTSSDISVVIAEKDGKTRVLSTGWTWAGRYLAWSPRGDEIWFSATRGGWNATLRAVSLAGRERLLLNMPGWTNLQDVSPDGRVLLTNGTARSEIRCRSAVDDAERQLSWFESSSAVDLSRDGSQVLFVEVGNASPAASAYLRRTDGSPPERLGVGFPIALSPDGKWALAVDDRHGQVLVLPTGSGQPKTLPRYGLDWTTNPAWLPDSQHILVGARERGHAPRTYTFHITRGEPHPITPEGLVCTSASLDGKHGLCETTAGELEIFSFERQQAQPFPKLLPDETAVGWSANGDSVFTATDSEGPVRIRRVHLSSGSRDLVREIAVPDRAGLMGVAVHMTPDGASYCYSSQHNLNDLFLVEGLR